ncbi:hypothetical protein GCM10027605_67880 [Micromonospora zhanjiangensis]
MIGTAEALADAVKAASIGEPRPDLCRKFVPILRTHALLVYRLDQQEVDRRAAHQLGAISSPDVLDLLLDLPLRMPVPINSLTRWERSALRCAPRGTVSTIDGAVTREAMPPVSVDLAFVPARTWRGGLEIAGRFAPFCARVMVLHRRPRELDEVRLQARFYGIGVVVVDQAGTEVLVEPAPFRRQRFTAAGWQFLERAYQQVI